MSHESSHHPADDRADEAEWLGRERDLRGEPTERRAAGVMLRACSALPAASALLLMLAWTLGEALSDRYVWSQFFEWIPTILVIVLAGTGLAIAEVSRRLMKIATPAERSLPRLTGVIAAGALAWVGLVLYFTAFELNLARTSLNAVGSPDRGSGSTPSRRVVFWNTGSEESDSWVPAMTALAPDLCVVTSLRHAGRLGELAEAMRPDDQPEPVWTLMHDRFTILSRSPIRRAGYTTLGIHRGGGLDPREQPEDRYHDPGRAMFVELDDGFLAMDRPIIVWIVDLPSDLSLHKELIASKAAESIGEFDGPVLLLDESGRWNATDAPGMKGFPPPDLIVGDFNIPRGSRSLRLLTGAPPAAESPTVDQSPAPIRSTYPLIDSWRAAGRGYTMTYPRRRPLLHIDQIYHAPWIATLATRDADLGTGTHRAILADITYSDPARVDR
jgi:hypothetical protein